MIKSKTKNFSIRFNTEKKRFKIIFLLTKSLYMSILNLKLNNILNECVKSKIK